MPTVSDAKPYGDPGEIDMRLDQDDLAVLQEALCMWRVDKQAHVNELPPGTAKLYRRSDTLVERVGQALDAFQYERLARGARAKAVSTELRGASLDK